MRCECASRPHCKTVHDCTVAQTNCLDFAGPGWHNELPAPGFHIVTPCQQGTSQLITPCKDSIYNLWKGGGLEVSKVCWWWVGWRCTCKEVLSVEGGEEAGSTSLPRAVSMPGGHCIRAKCQVHAWQGAIEQQAQVPSWVRKRGSATRSPNPRVRTSTFAVNRAGSRAAFAHITHLVFGEKTACRFYHPPPKPTLNPPSNTRLIPPTQQPYLFHAR
jgi:hypothetical protein